MVQCTIVKQAEQIRRNFEILYDMCLFGSFGLLYTLRRYRHIFSCPSATKKRNCFMAFLLFKVWMDGCINNSYNQTSKNCVRRITSHTWCASSSRLTCSRSLKHIASISRRLTAKRRRPTTTNKTKTTKMAWAWGWGVPSGAHIAAKQLRKTAANSKILELFNILRFRWDAVAYSLTEMLCQRMALFQIRYEWQISDGPLETLSFNSRKSIDRDHDYCQVI